MKNKHLRSILISVLTLAVIAGFGYYVYENADKYLQLLNLSVAGVVSLFLLSLPFPLFNGMQNTVLYRSLGTTHFSPRDGFLIAATSSLANQLPLPGGVVSKGYYLKRRYNLSFALFTSSTLALFFCFVSLDGFIGLFILLYWALFKATTASISLWIGFGLMAALVIVFWLPVQRIRLPGGLHERFQRALEGWVQISRSPGMVLRVLGLQLVMIFMAALRFWLAFHMLSQNVTMSQVLLMSNASILTQLVSLAPGGLGVREAIVGGVASVLGFDPAVSILAVGLDRLLYTLMTLIVGGISTVIVGGQMADMPASPEDSASE